MLIAHTQKFLNQSSYVTFFTTLSTTSSMIVSTQYWHQNTIF